MSKIGIFGGTFNPIHNAHLEIAMEALHFVGLDQVLFIPSGCSYLKDPEEIASRQDRLNMVKMAVGSYPEFAVSRIEIDRPGNSYTYLTLKELREKNPRDHLYWIMGADNLYGIEHWLKPEMIFKSCSIIVTVRGDKDIARLQEKKIRLTEKFSADIIILPMEKIPLSSTMIRERITQHHSIRDLVPEVVFRYIQEKNLYNQNIDTEEAEHE
jgi:nicotinate-nucleotide adenylyltransferase